MSRTLAMDIGGTKTLVALVEGARILAAEESVTPRHADPGQWCDAIAVAARQWNGGFEAVGAAVSGVIADGRWSAPNPQTLPVPDNFPLAAGLAARLGMPVACFNDAQAAAWGEHRFGAAAGSDLFFVTVSTGIGGGAIIAGKLLTGRGGFGGSAGLTRVGQSAAASRIEDIAGGRWMARAAREAGHSADAPGVFAAAARGEAWARGIVASSADAVANLLLNLQLLFDPPVIVVGGGVGLAPGYIDQLQLRLVGYPPAQRPEIRMATLGKYAGAIGAADLAQRQSKPQGG